MTKEECEATLRADLDSDAWICGRVINSVAGYVQASRCGYVHIDGVLEEDTLRALVWWLDHPEAWGVEE